MNDNLKPRALRIWWLTALDVQCIGGPGLTWPNYLRIQFRKLAGRPVHGPLWVDPSFGHVEIPAEAWTTPLGRACERAGADGIVLLADDVELLEDLPGLVTDLRLRRA
jgi:hypothetical protein